MYDDDKSMDVQLICNQHVVTYNKLRGMKLMGLSDPWTGSADIITFNPEKYKG